MKHFLLSAMILISSQCFGQDIKVENQDGVLIGYNITSDDEVEVTLVGSQAGSGFGIYRDTVNIPESIVYNYKTYRVTAIKRGAFETCLDLLSVSIPNSVTNIGKYAFSHCKKLHTITIGSGVTIIDEYAFNGCDKLKKVIIHDLNEFLKIEVKGPNFISEVHHLYLDEKEVTDLVIPEGITSINSEILGRCIFSSITIPSSLVDCTFLHGSPLIVLDSIFVKSENPTYDSRENCNAIIETASNTLLLGCTNTVIPNSVTSIGKSAFYSSKIVNITIPNSVSQIGLGAFVGCTELKSISLPMGLATIEASTFWGCRGLSTISIPNSVKAIGDNAFRYCKGLTTITIPNSVVSIGESAFQDCESLRSATMGSGITSIGKAAFKECTSLEKVIVPDITTWCNIKFEDYSANPLYCARHLLIEEKEIEDLEIPDEVSNINNWAFLNCIGLKTVTLPNSLKSIGEFSFGEIELSKVVSKIETPFAITSDVFSSSTFQNAQLLVPAESIDIYKTTDGWKLFSNIELINTGLNSLIESNIQISCYGGLITIEGAEAGVDIEIYSSSGSKIGNYKSSGSQTKISTDIRRGQVLLIKIKDRIRKIIME